VGSLHDDNRLRRQDHCFSVLDLSLPPSFLLPPPAAPYLATTVSPAASTYTRARVVEGMQSYVPSERVTPVLLLPTADAWYCLAYGGDQ
jgi:hypothetical protein